MVQKNRLIKGSESGGEHQEYEDEKKEKSNPIPLII